MARVEMLMPKMGESIMEATVLSWLKKEGDEIEQDESVLEVATDKVDTEVPATHAGMLEKILAKEGDVVEVGKPIAVINTDVTTVTSNHAPDGENDSASQGSHDEEASQTIQAPPLSEPGIRSPSEPATPAQLATTSVAASPAMLESTPVGGNGSQPLSGRFYSPLVLNIAKEEDISMPELETVPGTGKEGRVTKKDILDYVKKRKGETKDPFSQPAIHQEPAASGVSASLHAESEIIEMDRMRKMIAERMVESKRISPHVTSFVEADVSNIVVWRDRIKTEFEKREGEKLTFTPIFIEALVQAIKDFPMVNISVEGDKIIKHRAVNIGMAVALPSGNLIVPVIKDADQLSLVGLSKKVNELAKKGRENKLSADDLTGGTYTISNVGSFGNWMGTPIILQPQVAIMAVGAIVKKPAVIETPSGDAIGIRHKMFLSHSYDHRVVDGSLGGMMVRRVADYLENFDIDRVV